MSESDALQYLQESLAAGEHWYVALLKTIARWTPAEETVGERHYRYLIGGEAFDWLILAERLIEEMDGHVPDEEREAFLFDARSPIEIDEEEFQDLIGTPKYQAYLNFLYGVTVEEALQLAVEEEVAKERHSHVWAMNSQEDSSSFVRIYGRSQPDLLAEFLKERGVEVRDRLDLTEWKEFTYWLFKYRIRTAADGARVASDTRKGLAALSRVEAAHRVRSQRERQQASAI